MVEAFLVIDAGSGSVKSFLISPLGEVLARSESLWDRDNWRSEAAWSKIVDSVSELMSEPSWDVLGLCSTSMREEFILLDEQGNEITFQLNEESEKHGFRTLDALGEEMYKSSGHWPVPNWIAGAILPWLKEAQLRLFDDISSILMISDWVNFKLCGEKATEGSSACETSLYDIKTNNWNWNLIDAFQLLKTMFPRAMKNGEVLGYVTKQVSEESGIPEGTPVVVGGADTQCGLLGMGVMNGQAGAVGGTTTPVQLVMDEPLLDSEMRTWSNNYLMDGYWILESNAGYTGRGVRWIKDVLLGGESSYTDLNMMAEKVPIGSNDVLTYLGPHLFDNSPPYWLMDNLGNLPVIPTITGSHDFDLGTLTRAVLEANCYGVKANLDQLVDISGVHVDLLYFSGGNAKSDLWMQIQSDVLDMPVHVPRVRDATAVGCAALASMGTGYYGDLEEALENMVKIGKVYEPRKAESKMYQSHYNRWMDTRERLFKP